MGFLELAEKRYSVRRFKKDAVPQKIIDKILKAGQLAPTAKNNQPQKVMVVNSPEGLEMIAKCTGCLYGAPLAMVISYSKDLSWKRQFDGKDSGYVDASIVATHLMMEAADLGIGSTWVMMFDPAVLKKEFDFPEELEPVAILVMGFAAEDAAPSERHGSRKSIEETVCYR